MEMLYDTLFVNFNNEIKCNIKIQLFISFYTFI